MSVIVNKMGLLADELLARPLFIRSLQTGALVGLGTLSGIAACLHIWVIPVILQARSTRAKLEEFRTVIGLGFRYLLPSGRIAGALLASMTYLFSRDHNPVTASRWKYCAAAMAVMLPVAPYEIYTIFPTNDNLLAKADELARDDKDNFQDERDRQVDTLLISWRRWHTGRVLMPLIATTILAWSTSG